MNEDVTFQQWMLVIEQDEQYIKEMIQELDQNFLDFLSTNQET